MLPQSPDLYSNSAKANSDYVVPVPLMGMPIWAPGDAASTPTAAEADTTPLVARTRVPLVSSAPLTGAALPASGTAAGLAAAASSERDRLYSDFQPLVRRLIRQYGGDDAELRQDLSGEIYFRFCALLEAYDPERGVPLRPYLVRQLTASVYTYARQQWRSRKREVSLEGRLQESGEGALAGTGRAAHGARASAVSRTPASGTASLSSLAAPASLSSPGVCAPGEWASDPTSAWDEAIVREEVLRCLPHLIAKLPRRQRQVLVWRYYEQRSFEDIADDLQVKVATTRSLLRHGLNTLRKGLQGSGLPADALEAV